MSTTYSCSYCPKYFTSRLLVNKHEKLRHVERSTSLRLTLDQEPSQKLSCPGSLLALAGRYHERLCGELGETKLREEDDAIGSCNAKFDEKGGKLLGPSKKRQFLKRSELLFSEDNKSTDYVGACHVISQKSSRQASVDEMSSFEMRQLPKGASKVAHRDKPASAEAAANEQTLSVAKQTLVGGEDKRAACCVHCCINGSVGSQTSVGIMSWMCRQTMSRFESQQELLASGIWPMEVAASGGRQVRTAVAHILARDGQELMDSSLCSPWSGCSILSEVSLFEESANNDVGQLLEVDASATAHDDDDVESNSGHEVVESGREQQKQKQPVSVWADKSMRLSVARSQGEQQQLAEQPDGAAGCALQLLADPNCEPELEPIEGEDNDNLFGGSGSLEGCKCGQVSLVGRDDAKTELDSSLVGTVKAAAAEAAAAESDSSLASSSLTPNNNNKSAIYCAGPNSSLDQISKDSSNVSYAQQRQQPLQQSDKQQQPVEPGCGRDNVGIELRREPSGRRGLGSRVSLVAGSPLNSLGSSLIDPRESDNWKQVVESGVCESDSLPDGVRDGSTNSVGQEGEIESKFDAAQLYADRMTFSVERSVGAGANTAKVDNNETLAAPVEEQLDGAISHVAGNVGRLFTSPLQIIALVCSNSLAAMLTLLSFLGHLLEVLAEATNGHSDSWKPKSILKSGRSLRLTSDAGVEHRSEMLASGHFESASGSSGGRRRSLVRFSDAH